MYSPGAHFRLQQENPRKSTIEYVPNDILSTSQAGELVINPADGTYLINFLLFFVCHQSKKYNSQLSNIVDHYKLFLLTTLVLCTGSWIPSHDSRFPL